VKGLATLERLPASEARDQLELALQVELGYALIPVKGWSAPESEQAFTRAGELGRRISDTPKLFRALWGLGAFHFVRGEQHRARHVADQCLGVARQHDDVDSLIEAYYLSGIVSCVMGEFVNGLSDLEECIRRYGPDERSIHRMLYGQDAKASALGWLSMALWCFGEPDAALARARESLALVRDSPQPFLLARGLAGVGFVHVFRGEPQGADSPLQQALALCAEHGFGYFHAIVAAFAGANLVVLGRPIEGIAQMQASISALRTIGSELLLTVVLGHVASAHCTLLQTDQGLAAIEDGLGCVGRNGEHWGEAELHRIRGHLLLTRGAHHSEEAEASYRTALEVAARQRARAYQLRAATSLAELWRGQGKGEQASALLADAVGAWPNELDSPDLSRARKAMQLLQPDRPRAGPSRKAAIDPRHR
jgi:predicted ATPase